MRVRRPAACALAAATLALAALVPAATGKPLQHVFVRAKGTITQMALDRSGNAAWLQVNATGRCYRVHRGRLLLHQNIAVTACHTPRGPTTVDGMIGPIVASSVTATSRLHIAWAEHTESYSETSQSVWVPAGAHRREQLASTFVDCGISGCVGASGRTLGPMASRDGIGLYTVNDVTGPPSCNPSQTCDALVTGGRIRRIHYTATGAHATTVPGAPVAAALATAGGRLAEQTYTAQGVPTQTIQIRAVDTGALLATIPVGATIADIAMSQRELAVLATGAGGRELLRYGAATGALLGTTPLPAATDRRTLGIDGNRILYQTPKGMFVYRIDLGHSLALGIGPRRTPQIDRDGVRFVTLGVWTVAHGGPPSAIRGIEFR